MFGPVATVLILFLFNEFSPSGPISQAVETGIVFVAILIFPMSIGISISRYRLWNIDRVINRTLVYGLLTALLALVYFRSVVLLQQILQALTGQRSPLAIVVSTLIIAARFAPLRWGTQDFIERRFYRRKYDAAQTLAQFAMTAQGEVNLNQLTTELGVFCKNPLKGLV